jgi:uncharacterized protein YecE (DUF72 family)
MAHTSWVGRFYIGLSGFSYKEWQGEDKFYPPELKQANFLSYYVTRYPSVELDGTWYQMPSEAGVQKWIDSSPADFRYTPKMHRRVTHVARLKLDEIESVKFFLKRLEPLEKAGKLGAILVQLPPSLRRSDERLTAFLDEIPKRDSLLWSMEFRHDSWHHADVESILRERNIAWVAADTDDADAQRRNTAGHIYARLRKTDYPEDLLQNWAGYFRAALDRGQDCYVYCKHEDAEAPWLWADRLIELVGVEPVQQS